MILTVLTCNNDKTKKFLFKTSLYGLKYYKINKKWSENASNKVQKSKIFLPHPPQP